MIISLYYCQFLKKIAESNKFAIYSVRNIATAIRHYICVHILLLRTSPKIHLRWCPFATRCCNFKMLCPSVYKEKYLQNVLVDFVCYARN